MQRVVCRPLIAMANRHPTQCFTIYFPKHFRLYAGTAVARTSHGRGTSTRVVAVNHISESHHPHGSNAWLKARFTLAEKCTHNV